MHHRSGGSERAPRALSTALSTLGALLLVGACAHPAAVECPPGSAKQRIEFVADLTKTWCETEAGVKHGPTRISRRGSPVESYVHRRGELHGPWRSFSPGGRLRSERLLREGREVRSAHWNAEGELERLIVYGRDGSQALFFRADGSLVSWSSWRDDALNGPFRAWHANGALAVWGAFQENRRVGSWLFWCPDGSLQRVDEHPERGEEGALARCAEPGSEAASACPPESDREALLAWTHAQHGSESGGSCAPLR